MDLIFRIVADVLTIELIVIGIVLLGSFLAVLAACVGIWRLISDCLDRRKANRVTLQPATCDISMSTARIIQFYVPDEFKRGLRPREGGDRGRGHIRCRLTQLR